MRRINSHLLPVFTLIVVCVLAHVCLLLAYRHGIAFPDSISYLLSAKALLAWESASSDWMRTPLVGLVLLLGQGMPNTGLPIFLLCALLFSFSIVLFYVFACELLKSRLAAFAAAFAVLLLQCTFFWTLFGAVWLMSDALYADLLFLGVLLLLLGMAKNNPYFLVPGSFVFGTAAALRPGSFIIFLFWLPILIIVARNSRLWLASTCVCIAVFFAPSAAWAFHQWSVYGVVGTQAFGQYLLLIRTLSLVQPGDRVFADPEDNKKFLRIVEESRRKHGDSFEAYIYQ